MRKTRRRSIAYGLPSFGQVSIRWTLAFSCLQRPMNSVCPYICNLGFEVGIARNNIVSTALSLDPRPERIFFLDDDVIVHPYCLVQLLKADKDIIGGVYYTKEEFAEPLMFGPAGTGTIPYHPGGGVKRIETIGGGMSLVRLDVYEQMAKTLDLGTDVRGNPRWYYTSGDQPGEQQINEDAWFCERAREAGYKVYADQHPYAFGWHHNRITDQGYPIAQWNEYQKHGRAMWSTSDLAEKCLIAEGLADG